MLQVTSPLDRNKINCIPAMERFEINDLPKQKKNTLHYFEFNANRIKSLVVNNRRRSTMVSTTRVRALYQFAAEDGRRKITRMSLLDVDLVVVAVAVLVVGNARRLIAADLGLRLRVRVLSGQHFPIELGRDGLQARYLGRDRRRWRRSRGVCGRCVHRGRGRVVVERIAAPAHGGRRGRRSESVLPVGLLNRRGRDHPAILLRLRGAANRRPVADGGGLRGAHVPHRRRGRVRLGGARHRHRRGRWFIIDGPHVGRASDVLERRFGGHARVVRPRPDRHAHRDRPDDRRRRLRVHVHGHFCRFGHGGGGGGCCLRERHRGGRLDDVGDCRCLRGRGRGGRRDGGCRLCARGHGRWTETPFRARGGRLLQPVGGHPFGRGGRARRHRRRRGLCRHSHVPAHRYAVDAHLFGRDDGGTPVQRQRWRELAAGSCGKRRKHISY